METGNGSTGRLKHSGRLGRRVCLWYLTVGVVLAVTRVSLFVWMVRRAIRHGPNYLLLDWLFPEIIATTSLPRFFEGLTGAEYYLAYGSVVAMGSFVLATPILLVGWLRRRRTVRPSP